MDDGDGGEPSFCYQAWYRGCEIDKNTNCTGGIDRCCTRSLSKKVSQAKDWSKHTWWVCQHSHGRGADRTGAGKYAGERSSACRGYDRTDIKDICITESDTSVNYKLLYPGESLEIPVSVVYSLNSENNEVSKIMGFDLRNSLYSDPMNYKFEIKAKYSNNLSNNTRKIKKVRYNPVIIN